MTRVWIVAISVIALLDQSVPRLGESIEVSIVNVDVFVTDRDGRRVHGLKKEDFEIFEDGKRQAITNFAEYSGAPPIGRVDVTVAKEPQKAPRQKRTIVVFIDRFTLPQFSSEPMFGAIRSFLRQVVRPGDAVTIVSWRRQVVTRLPFTDNLDAVERVLGAIQKESSFVSADVQPDIVAEKEFEQEMADFAAAHHFSVERLDEVTFTGEEAAQRAKFEMRRKVSAINSLIGAVSAAEGTKAVILATHRFSRVAGKEYLRGLDAQLGPKTWSERDYDMSNEIESVTKTANANNVRVYSLYPEGLGNVAIGSAELKYQAPSPVFDQIVLDNELDAMKEVSSKTGGNLAWGSKDIVQILPAIRDDFDSYYSLAYRVTASGTDKSHNIAVKVKNRQYTVRSRTQYVEKSDATRMKERVVANLFGTGAGGTIPVNISLGAWKSLGKGRRTVPVVVSFPSASLTTVPEKDGPAGAFSVFVGWGNGLGLVGDITHQTRSFRIPPDHENASRVTFTYEFEMLVDEKASLISVGVMDEVAKEFGLMRMELARQ
jgi:VWFA-related protein